MKTRLISAAVLLPVLIIVLLALPEVVTAVMVGLMAALGSYELLHNTGLVQHKRVNLYCMLFAFLVSIWCHADMPQAWGVLGILVLLSALFGEMMIDHVKLSFEMLAYCLFAALLVPYLLSSVVRILNMENGRLIVAVPFLLAFLPDSGAYFAGRYFGKHKLAPVISPKKTVEGAIGAGIVAVLGMLLYAFIMDVAFTVEVSYTAALIYGVLGAAADVFGDLMFSSIKRQTGIKDYGNLIPGHGGILDRFDSMMTVGPLTEVLLLALPVVV